jgi:hypothetical protein
VKALTIRQPYVDSIVYGTKRIENRSWPLPAAYTGTPILLHSAKANDRRAIHNGIRPETDVRGAILAVITFPSYHRDGDDCTPNCAFWGQDQVFHWQIADVTPLPMPVPAKGQQQFWTPTPDVLAAVILLLPAPATT